MTMARDITLTEPAVLEKQEEPADRPIFDQARCDALAQTLIQRMNEIGLGLMTSIGHRTGLFDAMSGLPASTSQEIADAAGLQERYVREWLGAMVTGRLVDYDPSTRTYRLPAEHAALLTRAASPNNLAAMMQWTAVLASVEDQTVEKFRHGGGVCYEHFHRFHEVMAAESAQTVVAGLFDHILPLVPGITDRLRSGLRVMDVGCGSGLALITLAQAFPRSRFVGYDLSKEAIEAARRQARRRELTNIEFDTRDATELGHDADFDLVTAFDIVHDQKAPDAVLRQIRRALKPGGVFLMQDIRASSFLEKNLDHPLGSFLYTISTMHCMSVSLSQGGAGLGTVWGEELAVRMLDEAGFHDVRVHRLPHDIQNNWYVMHRPGVRV